MIEGLRRIPLRRFEDERGWFIELMRASGLPKPVRQSNLSYSRAGVIRGLHYHERGQDDLFACVQGTVRVVVLDRETGETFTEDIGDDNPVAIYIPGTNAHGYEALTDCLFLYHVTEEYDPDDPDEHGVPWDDPRVVDLWSTRSPILSVRDSAVRPDHRRRRAARHCARETICRAGCSRRATTGMSRGAIRLDASRSRPARGRMDQSTTRRRPGRRSEGQRRRNQECRLARRAGRLLLDGLRLRWRQGSAVC